MQPHVIPLPRQPLLSRMFLHNWPAKLGSLLVAATLWYWMKREIEPLPAPPPAVTVPAKVRFP